MNAHSSSHLFRRRRLVGAIVVPVLSLVAAAGGAPGAARAQAQHERPVVQLAAGALDACGAPTSPKNDLERSCLRGRIRTLTEEHRTARAGRGGVVEGDIYSITRRSFDARGNQTLIELSDSSTGPVGVFSRWGVFSFDAQGRPTGSKFYVNGSDEPKSVVAYSYDERGNRIKVDSSRTEPDAHIIHEFSYDEEGREVGVSFRRLTPGGWQTGRRRVVTTVEGGLTSVRTYSPDGAPRGRTEVLRDERGNRLGEELYHVNARGEEQLHWKVTYRYDGKGLLREVFYHKADAWLRARAVYEYDEVGNVTSLTRYNADGTFAASEHREYEYDAAGNWVRRVKSSRASEAAAPVPHGVDRRHFTYY